MSVAAGVRGLQGSVDHLGDGSFLVGARKAGEENIVQPFQSKVQVPLAPLADGHDRQPHPLGDGGVGFTARGFRKAVTPFFRTPGGMVRKCLRRDPSHRPAPPLTAGPPAGGAGVNRVEPAE